jgi:E3 ubiquitin-protein ligase NEDD4
LVTCPLDATPGQKIRFRLPAALIHRHDGPKSKLAEIKLFYDKDGWSRTIRATDMKFQWTRFDADGGVDTRTRFDIDRSAYVLKLDRTYNSGRISLVTPEKGVVDSSIVDEDGEILVSFTDIVAAQNKCFDEKVQWFHETCRRLRGEWEKGHVHFNVRRDYLLSDSMMSVMSLNAKDLRKVWTFEFIGEPALDAGGVAKEWFELVISECFDPARGFWQPCTTNQMCLQINPASEILCPEDYLYYYRFIGRMMGKAMFDEQIVKGHMVRYMYKHMLSWPIMFHDLKDLDEGYYNSLKLLNNMAANVEDVGVNFTITEDNLGSMNIVELIRGGTDVAVTEENLPEYIEACLKYHMMGRCEKQINELLLGFFDVIPEPLLTVFDFQELELLMCGMPDIDMQDWIDNTEYSGEYEGPNHQTCIWFWEVVSEYDHEMKARLLQFVTGKKKLHARSILVRE